MAGSGRRTFAPGEVLTASNVMNYLQDQAVMSFAGTAARGSAIGTAVAEGMVSYLRDTNDVQVYDGSAWNNLAYQSFVGLVPITAGTATVAGAGASVSENALGTITFGTATSLTLDGVFTSTYSNYKIVMDFAASASGNITAQFRNANSTLSAASYAWATTYFNAGAGAWTSETANAVTSAQVFTSTITSARHFIDFNITNPTSSSTQTGLHGTAMRARNTGMTSINYAVNTATDGIYLLCSTGNFSGKLTVYGWNQ